MGRRLPPSIVRAIVALAALAGALISGMAVSDGQEPPPRPTELAVRSTPAPPPAAVGPSRFELRLPGTVRRLNAARRENRRRLARSDGARAQAGAARGLQRAYGRAIKRLGAPEGRREKATVAGLRGAAAAYGKLAAAARGGRPRRYARAARAVAKRERRLAKLLRAAR